jgi:NAD(P)H-hydrate epimerase
VDVRVTTTPERIGGDAAVHFAAARAAGISISFDVEQALPPCDAVLDCLLGTGASGPPRGGVATALRNLRECPAPVVACDLPSGVDADTGAASEDAVRAVATLALTALKRGLLLHPGAAHAGRIVVAPIGIPSGCFPPPADQLATRELVREWLPKRTQHRDANKGTFGKVLVLAGSAGMAGAAVLTATAALRAGAGLVHLAVPESLLDTAATLAPEIVLHALPETPLRGHGGPGARERLLALAETVDALAVGPGLGADPASSELVHALTGETRLPLVIDADGLRAFTGMSTPLRTDGPPPIVTPHPGEMARLRGLATSTVQADRWETTRSAAEQLGAVVLLKGARTLIGEPNGAICVNRDGSPALATAGSGDVLTGAIAALLAAGAGSGNAARAGAYLHACAGERVAEPSWPGGALARDLRDQLPAAWRDILEFPDPHEPAPCC